MTKSQYEQLNKNHEIMVLWLNGKKIQVKRTNVLDDTWTDFIGTDPSFDSTVWEWRVKPEPKLRPWKPEEVPVGALVILECRKLKGIILSIDLTCGTVLIGKHELPISELHTDLKHSLDGGKTWHPCGVLE